MTVIHHSAICVRDIEQNLRFWRDGLGFEVLMDQRFEGDWPTLLDAPSHELRAVFLGEPDAAASGIVELVDLGGVPAGEADSTPREGFLLLSVMVDVESALKRLSELGLGGEPRRISAMGVAMAVVQAPDGTRVELVDTPALANLDAMEAGRR